MTIRVDLAAWRRARASPFPAFALQPVIDQAFHELRHTFAAVAPKSCGLDMFELSRAMGDADYKTTDRIYTCLCEKDLAPTAPASPITSRQAPAPHHRCNRERGGTFGRMDLARKLALLDEQIAQANQGQPADFEAWQTRSEVVFRRLFGNASPMHSQFNAIEYLPGMWFEGMDTSGYQPAGVRQAIALMEAAKLELEITEEAEAPAAATTSVEPVALATRVFIVHGQDDGKKYELESYLQKLLLEPPTILHQEPNGGQVLIEKFENSAASVGYAVVLLTGDDVGRAKLLEPEDDQSRARQNVVFEMGFFFGLIGRKRVAVLYDSHVELPSDISGLLYIPLDSAGAWKGKLASEMNHAGIPVDWTAIGRS